MAATTIPARLANMAPGTIPVGTNLKGFGRITRVSLTAYEVDHRSWLPFVHVHTYRAAEALAFG